MTLMKAKPELFGTGPVIPVHDVQATVDFYCDVLGFELDFCHGDSTRSRFGDSLPRGHTIHNRAA